MKTLITLINEDGNGVYAVVDGDFSDCHDKNLYSTESLRMIELDRRLGEVPALSPEEALAELGSTFKLAIVYVG